jgi:hypothetical protein
VFRSDLVEILNSRSAWALVGSGASIDAGLSSWPQLISDLRNGSSEDERQTIDRDPGFKLGVRSNDLPLQIQIIEKVIGRERVESLVRHSLSQQSGPTAVVDFLTDWPFQGYITTNYDSLIEGSLNRGANPGWIPVGNQGQELRKVAGSPKPGVVWHIHGSLDLPADASRLILTTDDYDDTYLEDTPAVQQLKAVMSLHRLIIVGFGLQDPDVLRILKRVGRLTDPSRPAIAFVPQEDSRSAELDPHMLLDQYNIDTITYRVKGNSHRDLMDQARVYGSFILRRSIQFGQPLRACPSHDSETTGLLLYNQLAAGRTLRSSDEVVQLLIRSRVLALLAPSDSTVTIERLEQDLESRAALLQGGNPTSEARTDLLATTIEQLTRDGLLRSHDGAFGLTAEGRQLVDSRAAQAEAMSDQFLAALLSRARQLLPDDDAAARTVASVANTFLRESIEKRALGVSMSQHSTRSDFQDFHVVALLQALPQHLETLTDDSQAMALAQLVQQVFANPHEAEARYIGLSLQAQFGAHLLGYDEETLSARIRDFGRSAFLLDSSSLIPLLAASSPGHESASSLYRQLASRGCNVLSTNMLAGEVAEHARWALRKVDEESGHVNISTLEASTGRAGERPNAFLEGFLIESGIGGTSPDIHAYLDRLLGTPAHKGKYTNDELSEALAKKGIECKAFNEWEGFSESLSFERDKVQNKIAELRRQYETYHHERQVRAEAEALLVVQQLRSGHFHVEGQAVSNAFFVSQTRAIDTVAGDPTHPITIRPESVLQWLATLNGCGIDELATLTSGLLWELSERGFTIVDPARLVVTFGPLVTAAQDQLQDELERHHAVMAEAYGESSLSSFREAPPLDVPIMLQGIQSQRLVALQSEIEQLRGSITAHGNDALSAKERAELERFRSAQTERTKKAESKRRSAESSGGNTRKKKKRRRRQ